jgi:hypothetical protein
MRTNFVMSDVGVWAEVDWSEYHWMTMTMETRTSLLLNTCC